MRYVVFTEVGVIKNIYPKYKLSKYIDGVRMVMAVIEEEPRPNRKENRVIIYFISNGELYLVKTTLDTISEEGIMVPEEEHFQNHEETLNINIKHPNPQMNNMISSKMDITIKFKSPNKISKGDLEHLKEILKRYPNHFQEFGIDFEMRYNRKAVKSLQQLNSLDIFYNLKINEIDRIVHLNIRYGKGLCVYSSDNIIPVRLPGMIDSVPTVYSKLYNCLVHKNIEEEFENLMGLFKSRKTNKPHRVKVSEKFVPNASVYALDNINISEVSNQAVANAISSLYEYFRKEIIPYMTAEESAERLARESAFKEMRNMLIDYSVISKSVEHHD